MPRAKMMDMGISPTSVAVWMREDAVHLWLTLNTAYGSKPPVREAQS